MTEFLLTLLQYLEDWVNAADKISPGNFRYISSDYTFLMLLFSHYHLIGEIIRKGEREISKPGAKKVETSSKRSGISQHIWCHQYSLLSKVWQKKKRKSFLLNNYGCSGKNHTQMPILRMICGENYLLKWKNASVSWQKTEKHRQLLCLLATGWSFFDIPRIHYIISSNNLIEHFPLGKSSSFDVSAHWDGLRDGLILETWIFIEIISDMWLNWHGWDINKIKW